MPIDHEIRSKGLGATDIAAILGMSPWADRFSVYVDKLGLIKRKTAKPWQQRGKYFERGIVAWYGDITKRQTEWFDTTIQNPDRSWQVCTPDAFVLKGAGMMPRDQSALLDGLKRIGGVDAKTVNFQHREGWGEGGTDAIPDYVALQLHWSCSTANLPWWDCAALLGMDDLRIYRVHRDAKIEQSLLEEGYDFWHNHILAGVRPSIGSNEAAKEYLLQRFPKNIQALRFATAEEAALMANLKAAGEQYDVVNDAYDRIANEIREAIGDSDGLVAGKWKVTWKFQAAVMGIEWSDVAMELGMRCEMLKALVTQLLEAGSSLSVAVPEWWEQKFDDLAKLYEIEVKKGGRVMRPSWGRKQQGD